jgi:hypothetical protein
LFEETGVDLVALQALFARDFLSGEPVFEDHVAKFGSVGADPAILGSRADVRPACGSMRLDRIKRVNGVRDGVCPPVDVTLSEAVYLPLRSRQIPA